MSDGVTHTHISARGKDLALAVGTEDEVRAHVQDWYRDLGGGDFFDRLCTTFYRLVAADDLLAPLFDGGWAAHARRLATHYRRMYGDADLGQAWSRRLLAAHTKTLISHDHRNRWIELFTAAGREEHAPEPQFTELISIMRIASGDMMAASRGAALQRGERFDQLGRPSQ